VVVGNVGEVQPRGRRLRRREPPHRGFVLVEVGVAGSSTQLGASLDRPTGVRSTFSDRPRSLNTRWAFSNPANASSYRPARDRAAASSRSSGPGFRRTPRPFRAITGSVRTDGTRGQPALARLNRICRAVGDSCGTEADGGNRSQLAAMLGIGRTTLYRRLRTPGIDECTLGL
jgi:hypothetical protein